MLEADRIEYEALPQPPIPGREGEEIVALMRILVRGAEKYRLVCEGYFLRKEVNWRIDVLDVFDSVGNR